MHPAVRLSVAIGRHVWEKHSVGGAFDRDATIAKMVEGGSDEYLAVHTCLQAEWYGLGLPRVVVGHRHAASLMSTTMRAEDVPDLVSPWSVFMLDVPGGMVRDSRGHAVAAVLVLDIDDGHQRTVSGLLVPESEDHTTTLLSAAGSVASLADAQSGAHPSEQVLARYVVGVVAELSSHREATSAAAGAGVKRDPRGNPVTRTFTLTRPVSTDCRGAVTAYLSGRSASSPSVQVLVRGHWRKQRHGKGLSECRWQHIEPYWRGPEEAPIALRPHAVKPDRPGSDAG